jgi:hypothetical protein
MKTSKVTINNFDIKPWQEKIPLFEQIKKISSERYLEVDQIRFFSNTINSLCLFLDNGFYLFSKSIFGKIKSYEYINYSNDHDFLIKIDYSSLKKLSYHLHVLHNNEENIEIKNININNKIGCDFIDYIISIYDKSGSKYTHSYIVQNLIIELSELKKNIRDEKSFNNSLIIIINWLFKLYLKNKNENAIKEICIILDNIFILISDLIYIWMLECEKKIHEILSEGIWDFTYFKNYKKLFIYNNFAIWLFILHFYNKMDHYKIPHITYEEKNSNIFYFYNIPYINDIHSIADAVDKKYFNYKTSFIKARDPLGIFDYDKIRLTDSFKHLINVYKDYYGTVEEQFKNDNELENYRSKYLSNIF